VDCGHPVLVCDDDGFFVVVEVGYDFAVSHEAFTDWSYFHGAFPLVIFGGMGFPAWKIDMRRAPVPLGSGALFIVSHAMAFWIYQQRISRGCRPS